jgi:hypothetical protein
MLEEENKRFTIQYTKEELDKITLGFVTQINMYIARVNNRIIKTFNEIEKEVDAANDVEVVPHTNTVIEEKVL